MTPGIYPNMPFAQYREIEAVNASLLWTCHSKAPAHAKWEMDHPANPTPALEFGRKLHMAVLEPDTFVRTYTVAPKFDLRTRVGKDDLCAWQAANAGREPLKLDEAEQIEAMVASVRASQARDYVTGGRSELTLLWVDKKTGLLCKARLDFAREAPFGDVITDLKTTDDASAVGFRRSIWKYGYALPAAEYVEGWFQLTGEHPLFYWLAIEKTAPYCVKAYEAGEKTLRAGRNLWRRTLDRWASCVKQNDYPAYGDKPEILDLDQWQLEICGVGQFEVESEPDTPPITGAAYADFRELSELARTEEASPSQN